MWTGFREFSEAGEKVMASDGLSKDCGDQIRLSLKNEAGLCACSGSFA